MPKGNKYPAIVDAASLQKAQKASTDFKIALDFIPHITPDVLTSATITESRLPLADKALEVALAAPDVMRKSFDPQNLTDKLAYYRALVKMRNDIQTADVRFKNALNALGADIMVEVSHIHTDVEKDNGETMDLGQMRTDLHAYYAHPGARKGKGDDEDKDKKNE